MNISFYIGMGFVEFTCHAIAAVLYLIAGTVMATGDNGDRDSLVFAVLIMVAVVLNTIGASL